LNYNFSTNFKILNVVSSNRSWMNMVFFYLSTGVVAGILGGIFLVSFFYNPESLFMPR